MEGTLREIQSSKCSAYHPTIILYQESFSIFLFAKKKRAIKFPILLLILEVWDLGKEKVKIRDESKTMNCMHIVNRRLTSVKTRLLRSI